MKNGDIEDFPGLDPLQTFPVHVENGDVYVSGRYDQLSAKSSKTKSLKEVGNLVKPNDHESGTVVVIGGGGAAQVCVETLRRRTDNPWQGRIVIITQEQSLPYDRPKVKLHNNTYSGVLNSSATVLFLFVRKIFHPTCLS